MAEDNTTVKQFDNTEESQMSIPNAQIYVIIQVVNIGGLTLALGLIGVVTNIINMVVFFRIGFSETINISFFVMSLADFGASFFGIGMAAFMFLYIQQLDLPFEPFSFGYLVLSYPRFVLTKITTVTTAFISFERCLCVAMPLKVKFIITRGRVEIFMVVTWFLVLGSSAPYYFYQGLEWTYVPFLNKSILFMTYYEDRRHIEELYYTLYNSIYSFIAFILVLIFTAILVINLSRTTTWRQSATSGMTTKEDFRKERKVSKFVVIISSLFIACYLPHNLITLLTTYLDPEISIVGSKSHIYITMGSFMILLEGVNSASNMPIYYMHSSTYKKICRSIFGCQNGKK